MLRNTTVSDHSNPEIASSIPSLIDGLDCQKWHVNSDIGEDVLNYLKHLLSRTVPAYNQIFQDYCAEFVGSKDQWGYGRHAVPKGMQGSTLTHRFMYQRAVEEPCQNHYNWKWILVDYNCWREIMKQLIVPVIITLFVISFSEASAQSRNFLETIDQARQRHSSERYQYQQRSGTPLGGYRDSLGDPAPRGTERPGFTSPKNFGYGSTSPMQKYKGSLFGN